MNEPQTLDLIGKYLSGNIAPAEREQLLAWAAADKQNRQYFDEMIQLWGLVDDESALPDYGSTTVQAWQKFTQHLDPPAQRTGGSGIGIGQPAPVVRPLWGQRRAWWSVAAAILLLISVWWIVRESPVTPASMAEIVTTQGERRSIILPDSTEVWLNQNSTLRYASAFQDRRVELIGEGYFSVRRDEKRPFVITSGEVETTVLGTVFNVRAYPGEEDLEVSVVSGKVQVKEAQTQKQVLLEAGKAATYNRAEKTLAEADTPTENADAWVDQQLVFEGTPLRAVINDLELYYGIQIQVENPAILNCTFSGQFEKLSAEAMLQILSFALNLQLNSDETQYTLSGAGCE